MTRRSNPLALRQRLATDETAVLEFLAALFQQNALGRPWGKRVIDSFREAAYLGNVSLQKKYAEAQRDERLITIGHVILCSDPLLNGLFKGAENMLAVTKRPGTWLAYNDIAITQEIELFKGMKAPYVFVLMHKDQQKIDHPHSSDCGCKALSNAVLQALEQGSGKKLPPAQKPLDQLIREMAFVAGETMQRMNTQPVLQTANFVTLQEQARLDLLQREMKLVKEMLETITTTGEESPRVIGLIVDQYTGKLELFDPATRNLTEIKPQKTTHTILRDWLAHSMVHDTRKLPESARAP